MQSKAATVQDYLDSLPDDRRTALQAVRKVITDNLDPAIVERMSYGMIGYAIPHSVYPAGYHCDPSMPLPYAGLASQKNHMSLYLMSNYGDKGEEGWFRKQWARSGKKLDMGKCCIRFKKLDDLALDVIGEAVRRISAKDYIAHYEAMLNGPRPGRPAAKAAKKPAGKKAAAKKTATKPARKPTRKPARKAAR